MPDNYKNDIYRDIKCKLDNYTVEYNPSAWRDMSDRLDREMPAKRRYYLLYIIIASIIAMLVAIYFMAYSSEGDSENRAVVFEQDSDVFSNKIPSGNSEECLRFCNESSDVNHKDIIVEKPESDNITVAIDGQVKDTETSEYDEAVSGYDDNNVTYTYAIENTHNITDAEPDIAVERTYNYNKKITSDTEQLPDNKADRGTIAVKYNNNNTDVGNSDKKIALDTDCKPDSKDCRDSVAVGYNYNSTDIDKEELCETDSITNNNCYNDSIVIPEVDKKRKRRRRRWFSGVSLELPSFTDNLYNGFVGPTVISATYSPGIMFNGIATSSSFSHGGEITFTGPLSSRMQFGFGVAVRDTKWKQKKDYSHTEKKDTIFVTILDSTLHIDNSSLYMQVPLFINYSLYKTQYSSAYISVGVSAVITAKQRSTETVIAGSDKQYRNKSLGFGDKYSILGVLNLGVGYRHRLNDRFNLFGELKYNAAIGKSGLYGVKNSSVTFGVGVSYRFGKKYY